MSDFITSAGAIAGAVSAILALIVAVLIKPICAWRKRINEREREQAEFRAKLMDKLDAMNADISALTSDIGDLQYERLSQSHDFYTERGWCPTSKKNQLCTMYKSYTAKGRNHLSKFYEQEILALPDSPEKGEKT